MGPAQAGQTGEGAAAQRPAHYTGAAEVQADGASLLALMSDLDRRCPGLAFRVVDEQQRLRHNLRIFVNGRGTRDLNEALGPADRVAIVLALSGG